MKINFEYVTALQYEVKALQAKIKAYESGEAYRIQREEYEKKLREKDRIIRSQKEEIFRLHQEIVTVRKNWMQVFEDLEKVDLCQYFGQKKLKIYAAFFSSSSSFCWGVI